MLMPIIRAEKADDVPKVNALNMLAFPTEAEANLVDALRDEAQPVISLVAVEDDAIVGHIMFTPVELLAHPSLKIMGLGPMAVIPGRQRGGIGTKLVEEGLKRCRETGAGAVVVLGHPSYYPRFGFEPASQRQIDSEYDVPPEVFMIIELIVDFLSDVEGTIRYHAAFAETT
jgi:putative acetyltransferase